MVPILLTLLLLAGAGTAAAIVLTRQAAVEHKQDVAKRFAAAWAKRDTETMWKQLSPQRRRDWPLRDFRASYREADAAATVKAVKPGKVGEAKGDRVPLPVTVQTRNFGPLRGTISLPIVTVDGPRVHRLGTAHAPAGAAGGRAGAEARAPAAGSGRPCSRRAEPGSAPRRTRPLAVRRRVTATRAAAWRRCTTSGWPGGPAPSCGSASG